MASILSIASAFSIRGNNDKLFPSAVPGTSCPQRKQSNSTESTAPACPSRAQTFAVLSGKIGCASAVTTRSTSAVVQSTAARRSLSASESPSAHGFSTVKYLSAAASNDQITSSARENPKLS